MKTLIPQLNSVIKKKYLKNTSQKYKACYARYCMTPVSYTHLDVYKRQP